MAIRRFAAQAILTYGKPSVAIPMLFVSSALGWFVGNWAITMLLWLPIGVCFVLRMTVVLYVLGGMALLLIFDPSYRRDVWAKIQELRPKS